MDVVVVKPKRCGVRVKRLGTGAWLLLAGLGAAVPGTAADERRLIVAFVPSDAPERSALDAKLAERRCELVDRDVDVYLVDPVEIDALNAQDAVAEGQLERLRQLRDADATGLQLVLVGKDGGVKGRGSTIAALDDFLQRIDGMPMRQAEVRLGGRTGPECS